MDFQNAQLPALLPLAASFAENQIEDELRQLFLSLFSDLLAEDTFDANVLGMAHLGSMGLVSRAITEDGLTMVEGIGNEQRARYTYRAWKSGNKQGRGLHFLRTYLQMQFPNDWTLAQQWHNKENAAEYPEHLSDNDGDGDNFLTSRLRIRIKALPTQEVAEKVRGSISLVLPARFIPDPMEFAVGNDGLDNPITIGQKFAASVGVATFSTHSLADFAAG